MHADEHAGGDAERRARDQPGQIAQQAVREIDGQDALAHEVDERGEHVGRRGIEVRRHADERHRKLPRAEQQQHAGRSARSGSESAQRVRPDAAQRRRERGLARHCPLQRATDCTQ